MMALARWMREGGSCAGAGAWRSGPCFLLTLVGRMCGGDDGEEKCLRDDRSICRGFESFLLALRCVAVFRIDGWMDRLYVGCLERASGWSGCQEALLVCCHVGLRW